MIINTKINFFSLSLLVSCCILVACSPSNQPEPSKLTWYQVSAIEGEAQGRIGDKIDKNDISISVLTVEEATSFGENIATAGNKFVGVKIEVQCHVDECEVSSLFARIQDAEENVFFVPAYIGKPTFGESKPHITKDEISKGWVAYEIPETSNSLLFIYEDLRSPEKGRVLISLEN